MYHLINRAVPRQFSQCRTASHISTQFLIGPHLQFPPQRFYALFANKTAIVRRRTQTAAIAKARVKAPYATPRLIYYVLSPSNLCPPFMLPRTLFIFRFISLWSSTPWRRHKQNYDEGRERGAYGSRPTVSIISGMDVSLYPFRNFNRQFENVMRR